MEFTVWDTGNDDMDQSMKIEADTDEHAAIRFAHATDPRALAARMPMRVSVCDPSGLVQFYEVTADRVVTYEYRVKREVG